MKKLIVIVLVIGAFAFVAGLGTGTKLADQAPPGPFTATY